MDRDMELNNLWNTSTFLKCIFAVALFLLIFVSGISYKHTLALNSSTRALMHSYKVNGELKDLVICIKDAEAGQRGYLLTHDSTFLTPYTGARKKINSSFIVLKSLTSDNIKQQHNLDTLFDLINLRLRYMAAALNNAAGVATRPEGMSVNLQLGKSAMDRINHRVREMIRLEDGYLNERKEKYQNEISFTPISTLLLSFFSLLVCIIAYIGINKNVSVLKRSNEDLLIMTESFKQAEIIGGFSSWRWNLETDKFSYSDNQFLLLGCEPQSFEPCTEKFLEFVHPDDRHVILEGDKQVKEGKPLIEHFRVIRKDGQLRYFKSTGNILTDNHSGEKILIGINCDITEQELSRMALEDKNRDLERSNKELASFNHIASHDLQEPLRKIQTFISRIADKESQNLSDTCKGYFNKIQSSANKMRTLIDDLLLFSRTNKMEKTFELTDLNTSLENVKQELAVAMEEKKATIITGKLPVINAIPFQIQQLFTNIIGNSLKYSRQDAPPVININCNRVLAKDYPALSAAGSKSYYKITIKDNGMGFEQEYAERIFVLFSRLHHAHEYPGTGLGLSICKKITENHSGYIYAEGHPGEGALFTIFLPA